MKVSSFFEFIVNILLYINSDCPFLLVPRTALTIHDILPEDPSKYDKMRPPKKDGKPTIVYFHVTVMGLDSIDEGSMVSNTRKYQTKKAKRNL